MNHMQENQIYTKCFCQVGFCGIRAYKFSPTAVVFQFAISPKEFRSVVRKNLKELWFFQAITRYF